MLLYFLCCWLLRCVGSKKVQWDGDSLVPFVGWTDAETQNIGVAEATKLNTDS